MVIEYRNDYDVMQFSYAYFAKVVGGDGIPSYEPSEIAAGFSPVWMPLDKAIGVVEASKTDRYGGSFAVARDLAILKKARELLKK